MSVASSFTQEQIKFIYNELFQTLADDFHYNLKPSKRKIAIAKAFKARNFDSLLQSSTKNNSSPGAPEKLLMGYKWYKKVNIDCKIKHLNMGDSFSDETVLSDIIFNSVEDAINAIKEDIFGYSEDSIAETDNAILVAVEHTIIDHPFISRSSQGLEIKEIDKSGIFSGIKSVSDSKDVKDAIDKSKALDSLSGNALIEVNYIDSNYTDISISYADNPEGVNLTMELYVHFSKDGSEHGIPRIYLSDEISGPDMDNAIEIKEAENYESWKDALNSAIGTEFMRVISSSCAMVGKKQLTVEDLHRDYMAVKNLLIDPILELPVSL